MCSWCDLGSGSLCGACAETLRSALRQAAKDFDLVLASLNVFDFRAARAHAEVGQRCVLRHDTPPVEGARR